MIAKFFFDPTVSENIAYRLLHADIKRAAVAANVHDFVGGLPQGYNTLVGENAALISGGWVQWLQIARVFVRPARCQARPQDPVQSSLIQMVQLATVTTFRRCYSLSCFHGLMNTSTKASVGMTLSLSSAF
jgi:ATP-binding cassette subfamily B (MDR/TAP) protein 1